MSTTHLRRRMPTLGAAMTVCIVAWIAAAAPRVGNREAPPSVTVTEPTRPLDVTLSPASPDGKRVARTNPHGRLVDLILEPHSVRAPGMIVRVVHADGTWTDRDPGPVRTYRGQVRDSETGAPLGTVAGGIDPHDEINAIMQLHGGRVKTIGPSTRSTGIHRLNSKSRKRAQQTCALVESSEIDSIGTNDWLTVNITRPDSDAISHVQNDMQTVVETLGLFCSNLGIDMSAEYFAQFDSVEECQLWIESIVNGLNGQFEYQTQISHKIALLVIRETEASEPVGPPFEWPSSALVTQEWFGTFGDVDWDIVHIFTEPSSGLLGSAIIGIACKSSSSQSFVSHIEDYHTAVRLSAHELAHNWGALHEGCVLCTMNPGLGLSLGTPYHHFDPLNIKRMVTFRDTEAPCVEICDELVIERRLLPLADNFEATELIQANWDSSQSNGSLRDGQYELSGGQRLTSTHMLAEAAIAIAIDLAWLPTVAMNHHDCTMEVDAFERGYQWIGRAQIPLDGEIGVRQDTTINVYGVVDGSGESWVDFDDFRIRVRVVGAGCGASIESVVIDSIDFNPCPEDCVLNAVVNIDDVMAVVDAFGDSGESPCDITPVFPDGSFGNAIVNIDDVLAVLNAFGPCD
ncbi:MAG: M12 family metallo-peptidase [Planctomycetota bacterium]